MTSIAIAGLGTVGASLVKLVQQLSHYDVSIAAVSARSKGRDRGVDISSYDWVDNAVDLANHDDVDVVVELMGGSDGPALALVEKALHNGKSVVTANKALMAHHGVKLAKLAEEKGVSLRYEAAVAGGIPIIKALQEGLAGDHVQAVHGILNGTCNYILSTMESEGTGFDEVLADAQALGYAEADPSFDVDGVDAAHKILLLAIGAFGLHVAVDDLSIEGIRDIQPVDIDYADSLGYNIRLLGVARKNAENELSLGVYPAMVPQAGALAKIIGPTNAVLVEAEPVGDTLYQGAGAGGGPTASAVLADVLDVVRGHKAPTFGRPVAQIKPIKPMSPEQVSGVYYVRLLVKDQMGVMADIASELAAAHVSIDSLLQRGRTEEGVFMVIITHETSEAHVRAATRRLQDMQSVLETPVTVRVETA